MANVFDRAECAVTDFKPPFRRQHFAVDRWLRALLISLLALGSGLSIAQTEDLAPDQEKSNELVAARGRIEPSTKVRILAAPAGSILGEVLVRQGEQVEAGQLLAQTTRLPALDAAVSLAERRLREARVGLDRVRAPAKRSDRDAQQAVVDQRQAELDQATDAYEDARKKQGKRKSSDLELKHLEQAQAAAERTLRRAQATLRSLSEAREIDIAAAKAQVDVATAQLDSARAERDLGEVRAPSNGRILQVNARAGESADGRGLLQLADLSQLMVVAEVDQRDIRKVEIGATARLSGGMLPEAIGGKVVRISNLVSNPRRPTSSLLNGLDARVVEVEIEADSPLPPVIGGEVDVLISAR
jgi:HlyD family secretion protein